ncbi:uncharacterized protein LOC113403984 [Vanessa tameamea]|uniref:Uncharacterized protein LOC113403984 n=1 Tax=Vanessa tameamea TaxID=334116 RepID=A0A8B8ITK5_VANTA|nr:major facilitator superfamily domain-containing protein 6 [Vanessa tameamea]XP_026500479.1 major facilitator superfamily domain-containing protein 6 [Vanessa tameamea]
MTINKKLLPIKGHFFLFNAGTAPLVPYLSTYARQLGFTSATVGLIYTILPIFGLVAKPLFGVIADRFKIQKTLFILFQVVTIVSFSAIYFIPENASKASVDLDCGNGASTLRSCYQDASLIDQCKVTTLSKDNSTAICNMKCDMDSPEMWQTVCEHWHIPRYCYNNVKSIKYTANINEINEIDDCVDMSSSSVVLDGYKYSPKCRNDSGYVNLNEPCSMNCEDNALANLINSTKVNMTCEELMLNLRLCSYDLNALVNVTTGTESIGDCEVICAIDSPLVIMEICESWNADKAVTCKANNVNSLPSDLSFDASLLLHKTMAEHKCLYMEVEHIKLSDGSIHYPYCGPKADYEPRLNEFHSFCKIECNNEIVNELLRSSSESHKNETQYTKQFWMFFLMMTISWIGQAVVVTFADAICFNLLGTNVASYGKQRLWGSVGWGIFSLLTGTLIDLFSGGVSKDYTVAFILMFVFMFGDVIVSCYTQVDSTKMSINILADVGSLLTSLPTFAFLLWTIAVGLCTGLLWQFLFWHIEDVAGQSCDGSNYVKTLQGLVSAIQTFGGEIPFMFLSGYLLKKIGHINMMTLVLFAFGFRFLLYSFLTDAWWILPIEMFQGITFGMFYPTMTSYANVVSPAGTETTVQGLVGAVFEGVGSSLGSFIGGLLYENYGGWHTFRWFGYGAFVACGLHVLGQYWLRNKHQHVGMTQGFTNVVRYGQGIDGAAVYMLADVDEDLHSHIIYQ